jgi:PhnB protein
MEDRMRLNAYLGFNGECEAAIKFYEKALGGKVAFLLRYGESPMAEQTPPALRDRIAHARLAVGDSVLMMSDAPPDHYEAAKGITINISIDDLDQAKRAFDALADGGTVRMPFGKTFWAKGFGMLTDRFGIPWMVNCEEPM